ncbi:hypothetical protein SAMN02745181_3838 [Rubritalea squalenifaciens DSM 18772]|uniref:Uncharacterized protein n=1 Tax=Rubritalea squalenifaciens DSM 18772 TaxID=1123071 RepID=A0A1M6SIS9_9BACT|nr:hypothetical protein [Rubritalea squalenifaciens]SHK44641.1 hypothetical protein SAMN02745181_3838 [Rubritalea squalenifaciens DSM 18772]
MVAPSFSEAEWPTNRQEVRGLEFDWPCTDTEGKVAIISSWGEGYIPASIFNNRETHNLFWKSISRLPSREPLLGLGCKPDLEFKSYAEKGVFVYDRKIYTRGTSAYSKLYSPQAPLQLSDLPASVQEWLPVIAFRFSDDTELNDESLYR